MRLLLVVLAALAIAVTLARPSTSNVTPRERQPVLVALFSSEGLPDEGSCASASPAFSPRGTAVERSSSVMAIHRSATSPQWAIFLRTDTT
ncbi:hypothetical protein WME94_35015 [Sorangium sp. So ce429]